MRVPPVPLLLKFGTKIQGPDRSRTYTRGDSDVYTHTQRKVMDVWGNDRKPERWAIERKKGRKIGKKYITSKHPGNFGKQRVARFISSLARFLPPFSVVCVLLLHVRTVSRDTFSHCSYFESICCSPFMKVVFLDISSDVWSIWQCLSIVKASTCFFHTPKWEKEK